MIYSHGWLNYKNTKHTPTYNYTKAYKMGIPTLILGESGSGKSTSLRNINPDNAALIQCVKKPLPFPSGRDWAKWDNESKSGSLIHTDNSAAICKAIQVLPNYGKEIIIIDDYQYTMANEFMRRVLDKETGAQAFNKYNEIARFAWDICMAAQNSPDNVRVYIMSHTQQDEFGKTKIKTIGKLLDEKITLEGLFTIVMRSIRHDGKYLFTTQNNGSDTVKTPMGLFESEFIDNDLNQIDQSIKAYYGIGEAQ